MINEYSLEELLNINWNRISDLSKNSFLTLELKRELEIRTMIQNKWRVWKHEETRDNIYWINKKTKINVKKYLLPKKEFRR